MKGLSCFHCGAEVTNGLALCETCQAGARVYLEFTPVYFRNLARWKPGRAGSRPVPGSRIPKGVLEDDGPRNGDRIGNALDEVGADLAGWAQMLHDERGIPLCVTETEADQATAACGMLARYLTSVSTTDWCGDLVRAMGDNEKRLRDLTETYVPGWYSGGCKQVIDGDECGSGTYVVPGLTWVTCQACGATTHAADHLDGILDEARNWLARPKFLAESVVALVETEASVPKLYTRIRQWAHQGQLTAYRHTARGYTYDIATERMVVVDEEVGQARYRLGDVLDRVLAKETPKSEARAS